MEQFKLRKPLSVGTDEGVKELEVLNYDFEDFTALDKKKAGNDAKKAGIVASVPELDSDYHFYIFAYIVSKCNVGVTIEDVFRISAKDSMDAAKLVRSYFFVNLEE